ncbi:MAG TPA: pyruvate formate lyase family protein [Bacteroidales bacterium]|nr:pyruvate formate lyase family protein [Bacteroidales bacterium]
MKHRISTLKNDIDTFSPGICPERALLWTDYFKKKANRKKPVDTQIAEAVRHVLLNKSVTIYPNEVIVGNYTSKRVGGIIYPELDGIGALLEINKFHKRATNPLSTTPLERRKLALTIPFWLKHNLPSRAVKGLINKHAFIFRQLTAKQFQIYEAGGISHFSPDYEKLLRVGATGIKEEAEQFQKETTDKKKQRFYEAVKLSAGTLAEFGDRYADCAEQLAQKETTQERKSELLNIASICRNVPRNGAKTFQEAVQSMMLGQIALFQESMGPTVCPGRIDQILQPYYQKDLENGRITRETAKEILAAFCIKLCENVPVFPTVANKTLGGFPSWQVVTVGGVDIDGNDATNDLSYILLELMDELRMRQPNFHVRLNPNTPQAFHDQVIRIHTGIGSAPALYNDDIIIKTMTQAGYSLADARNYVAIGCVEPTSQGKTLGSTDAAIINLPLALEMALNQGRCFDANYPFFHNQYGAKTKPVSEMRSMADVMAAYEIQLQHQMAKLHFDLQAIEKAHTKYHPTPLTSMLIDGCLKAGTCATAGGATYNFSGIQGVGITTVGDALYAIEKAVFKDKITDLETLVAQLKDNIPDTALHARLRRIDKFGNDHEKADSWTRYVADHYSETVTALGKNTRGGQYNAGLYSNTTHVHFGSLVGALPNGRRAGEPFASGIAPENGMDKNGPAALINSMNRLDFTKFANGINFNMKFDASSYRDDAGQKALASLFDVYFKRGGMQVQANMLDSRILLDARNNPALYPNLLIRVSGYSAYFNDLSTELKDEIISRSLNAA